MLKLIKIGRVNMKITKKELKKTIKKELKKELKRAKKKEQLKAIEQAAVQPTKEKPKSILVLTIGLAAQLIVVLELVLKILNVLKELI